VTFLTASDKRKSSASLIIIVHLQRKITKRAARETGGWVDLRIGKQREHLPP